MTDMKKKKIFVVLRNNQYASLNPSIFSTIRGKINDKLIVEKRNKQTGAKKTCQ
jgi:hypothetical protein